MICFVSAAMCPSRVVGEEGMNGGLWCSPRAKTSRPTFVGALGDLDDVADALGLALRVAGEGIGGDVADGEDSELHVALLSDVAIRRLEVIQQT